MPLDATSQASRCHGSARQSSKHVAEHDQNNEMTYQCATDDISLCRELVFRIEHGIHRTVHHKCFSCRCVSCMDIASFNSAAKKP